MNMPAVDARELLLRSLRDHDVAAKNNMRIATQHLKRGYVISRELERIERADSHPESNLRMSYIWSVASQSARSGGTVPSAKQ